MKERICPKLPGKIAWISLLLGIWHPSIGQDVVQEFTLGPLSQADANQFESIWPGAPKPAFVDPMTAAQGAAAVISIAAGLDSLFSGSGRDLKRIRRELAVIGSKLDALARGQEAIVEELHRLKIFFKQELRNEFIFALNTRLAAHSRRFRAILAYSESGPKRQTLEQLALLRPDVTQTAFEFPEYGPAAYQATFSGMALLEATYALERGLVGSRERSNLDRREKEELKQFLPPLGFWLEESNSEGIPSAIRALSAERELVKKEVDDHSRNIKLRRYEQDRGSSGRCTTYYVYDEYLVIDGDITTGFTDHRESKFIKSYKACECSGRNCPIAGELLSPMAGSANSSQQNFEKPIVRFGALHSLTTALNARRDRFLELESLIATQIALKENVEIVIAHISARTK